MNEEEITRKSIFMTGFRSKLTYPFSFKDLEEIETIIDFYEQKVNQLETNIEKATEILKLCNSQCAKETIAILEKV